jgi:intein/homing endonuclease
MTNKRRGSRPPIKRILRASPKSSGVSDYRKATIQEELENGILKQGGSYNGSHLKRDSSEKISIIDSPKVNRGEWILSDGEVVMGTKRSVGVVNSNSRAAIGAVAHSESYIKREATKIIKQATTVGSVGSGTSAGSNVERLAPEVYSPLFTMANLNLPRDRITVNAWCFVPGTMVVMADGTSKAIEQIKIGDEVLSANGSIQKVTSLFERTINEEIVGVKVRGTQNTIWTTKNHGFKAIKAPSCKGNKDRRCKSNPCSRCGKSIDYKFSKIPAGELSRYDLVYMPVPKENNNVLSKMELKLLGYYAAEGYVSGNEFGFIININETKLADKITYLIKLLFNYDIKVYKFPELGVIRIRGYNKKICLYLKKYCSGKAITKRLSKEIISSSPDHLIHFLTAWADGDGNRSKISQGTRFNGITSSKQMADQICFCMLKCGFTATPYKRHIQKTMKSPTNGKIYNIRPSYLIRIAGKDAKEFFKCFDNRFKIKTINSKDVLGCKFIHKDKCISWVSDVEKKQYSGPVYNIEVSGDHTYVVEDVAVYNCRNFFQLHPIVRNAITLHATYPISKLNLKCYDKKVLQFFEDMIEEMHLMESLGDLSLEYWKLGECVRGHNYLKTSIGMKKVNEVQIGDFVLTHTGKYQRITERMINWKHKECLSIYIQGSPYPVEVSFNHPFYLTKVSKFHRRQKKARIINSVPSFENENKWKFEWERAENVEINDICLIPINREIKDNKDISKDLCRVIGLYLSEGCLSYNNKKYNKANIPKCTIISNQDKKLWDYYENIFRKNHIRLALNRNNGHLRYNSIKRNATSEFAQIMKEYAGEYSKEKILSEEIMLLPPEKQMEIINAFIDGDGWIHRGRVCMATISINLAFQIRDILARNYITCSINVHSKGRKNAIYFIEVPLFYANKFNLYPTKQKRLNDEKEIRTIRANHVPRIKFSKEGHLLAPIKKIEKQQIDEPLYNFEVENDHSYCVYGIAVHNCFPYAELDENNGKWSKIIIQNPDYIHTKKTVLSGDPIISLKPDAVLQRLVLSNNPADVQLRKQIPEKIVYHVRAGQDIPLDNFNISHLKMLSSPYDVRGTSIIVSAFKDLMLYDKLRECFPISTEVLTKNGFKYYDDITSRDEIATINPKTNELEFQKYIGRTDYKFDGKLYHFYGKKIDTMVTPNHRMWLAKKKIHHKGYNNFGFVRAEDVKMGCCYKSKASIGNYNGNEISYINVNNKKIPIENYLEFLGYVISEGCIQYNEKTCQYSISICQNNNSKEFNYFKNSIEKIGQLLDVYVSEYTRINKHGFSSKKNDEITSWAITRKHIVNHFFNEIGSGSRNKKIPNWIKQLSPRLLKILLNALVIGDGSEIKSKYKNGSTAYRYHTVSKHLADDVQEILFKCGYASHLMLDENGQGSKFYLITWSNSNYGKEPIIYGNSANNGYTGALIEKVPYKGRVFCFEVPNGLFVTRRNGLITIQGNSKFAQADGLVNPITIIKVGGNTEGEYRATQEDLEFFRQIFEEAQYDKDFKLITHAGITVERVGASGQVLEIAGDMELIIKNIYTGLMVPPAVVDTESAVYASASIGLEVLRQRYFNFRQIMANWLVDKIFAPISEIQEFYEYKDGKKRLIVPEVEWNQMNLYDLQDYISNITGLVSSKQVSLQTLYKSLGLNYEDERVKMRKEAIDEAIKRREEQALGQMTLSELRSLDPEKEVMEPVDEKERETPPEAGMPTGMLGGAEMGMAGGLPELAPPPGGELGVPGAGAPEGGGVTPGLGPGTPGGPPVSPGGI